MKFLDLRAQYQTIKTEIDAAIEAVVRETDFIMGRAVNELESAVAQYCGVKHGVGLNSGTDALFVALKALNLGPGNEVITTPFSFFATVETIILTGAKPVFVDIDPRTFTIDPTKIEAAITPKTKAILPVHLYGQLADISTILAIAKKRNLLVIEDAAQAIGSTDRGRRACSFGIAGCLSFFPSKNLGAYGDGGMLVTNDERLAKYARQWRVHGAKQKYFHDFVGDSSRLDTIQAAILLVKLKHLDDWNTTRRAKAAQYDRLLQPLGIVTPYVRPDVTHIYHQYTIRVPEHRDALAAYLKEHKVPTMTYYPQPLHLLLATKSLGYHVGDFPKAERACQEALSLPIYPELPDKDIERIAQLIGEFLSTHQ